MPSRPLVSIPKPKIQYETLSVGIDSLSCLKLSLSRIALLRWLPKPNVGVQIRCTFYSDYSLKPAYVNYYCFDSRHSTSPPITSPPSQHPQPLPMALYYEVCLLKLILQCQLVYTVLVLLRFKLNWILYRHMYNGERELDSFLFIFGKVLNIASNKNCD